MNFDLYGITEVNTIDSYVVLKLSMNMWWHDDWLRWNPEEWGNITKTTFYTDPDSNEPYVWTPDVAIYENA